MGRDYKDIVRELWDKVPKMLEKAEETLEKCQAMMDTLENDDFLDIVYAYFDGFFELDGEIE